VRRTHGLRYALWRALVRLATGGLLESLRRAASAQSQAAGRQSPYAPLISVLMPVRDPPESQLRAAIESVLAQRYPHWELCVADDASDSEAVRGLLSLAARRDARIRVLQLEAPGGISRTTNVALKAAVGEFVALLDHDDTLAPHALLSAAAAIAQQPDLDMLYSDEDKIGPTSISRKTTTWCYA
jgi:glycosyltransferase involved in cell wall biosynthesis